MDPDYEAFIAKFLFREDLARHIGIEREHFLVDQYGKEIPRAKEFLEMISDPRWTYELSACQVEDRTIPRRDINAVMYECLENDNNAHHVAERLGIALANREVARASMPLDVYPDPRYENIVRTISHERLSAACRVTGTHIHVGVRDMEDAIATYNALVPHGEELCALGNHSDGERLRLYKAMATDWKPSCYRNAAHFYAVACARGFAEDPRNCWNLIRISRHGTIELRMFGVTDYVGEVAMWVQRILSILKGG
ncbi:MAG: hypothetical protein KGI50_00525 [Patescibacteria group bacterium]|nr:hypothetical protein [Patescibacteria group bacterium]MDE2438159.1 hypothetical protein [Patescibacteria group bacterium]